VWLTTGPEPGHLAVVTETGSADQATQPAGHIWAELARRYGPSLVLLEHHLAPQAAEGAETLDLVRTGADGSPHWLRIWPTPEEHPSHAGLELWMATYGHQIAGNPASWFDRCEDEKDLCHLSRSCPKAALRAIEEPSVGALRQPATPCASRRGVSPSGDTLGVDKSEPAGGVGG
jgi:hypothetical protein